MKLQPQFGRTATHPVQDGRNARQLSRLWRATDFFREVNRLVSLYAIGPTGETPQPHGATRQDALLNRMTTAGYLGYFGVLVPSCD